MNGIKERWHEEGYWSYFDGTYDHLVEDKVTVLESENLGSYQGDIVYLVKSPRRYGFLSVGYGSCSYCDALEACQSLEEVERVQKNIYNSIKWFKTLDEVKAYILSDDQELQWYHHEYGWEGFEKRVKEL